LGALPPKSLLSLRQATLLPCDNMDTKNQNLVFPHEKSRLSLRPC
jgi:hypothetical protein